MENKDYTETDAEMVQGPMESAWLLPSKMISYPAVTATITTATNVYSATKNYNKITEMTAEFAEKTAGAVAIPLINASKPLLTKMEPTLHAADKYAAEKLEKMEEKAPLMNEEPGKIYQIAKETTVSTINNSYVGQAVSSALQPLIGMAETWTPKTPAPEQEEEGEAKTSATDEEEVSSDQTSGQPEVSFEQTVRRVYTVGTKLQKRALDKAYENVTSLKKRSQETLASLTKAVDLIQYANSLEKTTCGTKMRGVIDELLQDDFEDSKEKCAQEEAESRQSDIDRKALVVTRNLTKKLGGAYEGLVTYAEPYVGATITCRLQQGHQLIECIHNTFLNAKSMKDVSSTCIEGAKTNIEKLSKILEDLSKDLYTYVTGSSKQGSVDFPIQVPRERDDSESSYNPSESLDDEDSPVIGHVDSVESEDTETAAAN